MRLAISVCARARSHPTPDAMRARRYGWCPMRRKCGGFAAKECGDDERYYAEGLRPPKKGQRSKQPPQPQPEPQPAAGGGTDMRAVFAKLTKQGRGIGAGMAGGQNICGGFANRECGGGGGGGGGGAARAPRNGLWGARAPSVRRRRAVGEVVAVDAPAASPQPAAVLRGPVAVTAAARGCGPSRSSGQRGRAARRAGVAVARGTRALVGARQRVIELQRARRGTSCRGTSAVS